MFLFHSPKTFIESHALHGHAFLAFFKSSFSSLAFSSSDSSLAGLVFFSFLAFFSFFFFGAGAAFFFGATSPIQRETRPDFHYKNVWCTTMHAWYIVQKTCTLRFVERDHTSVPHAVPYLCHPCPSSSPSYPCSSFPSFWVLSCCCCC